jgi:ribonuclease D
VENSKPLFLKFKGAGRLPSQNLAVLEKLLKYRRTMARKKDKPLFKVLGNASLLKIATMPPNSSTALKRLNTLSQKQLAMYGKSILTNVNKALAIEPEKLPKYPRKKAPILNPVVPNRIKSLRKWRDKKALDLGLDPTLLLNKTLLTSLASSKPTSLKKLDAIESLRRWQKREFGRNIVSILKQIT